MQDGYSSKCAIQNNQQAPLPKSAELITSAVGENTDEIENADETYDESSNSAHGLDSIVQDSVCPETVKDQAQTSVAHHSHRIHLVREQEEFGENAEGIKSPLLISNNGFRASQLEGINLQVVLNPSAARRITRSQQYEACDSNEGMEDEVDNYIFGSVGMVLGLFGFGRSRQGRCGYCGWGRALVGTQLGWCVLWLGYVWFSSVG
ncbi:hypothetical protein RHSIM_Rhsim06G0131900 [Rhododendron simsii]|uniref:Uncharacterized protein n=1 Tax=Rhododendron simsii TaxID=118357 RepID=A0A834GVG2_RHOSS|nr:hypothetical protein RHSIM_Rhsim06G0131900 [Rhododendron simsii]